MVLHAEYRGTEVAVKRMLPPKEGTADTVETDSRDSDYSKGRSSTVGTRSVGVQSWGGLSLSVNGGLVSGRRGLKSLHPSSKDKGSTKVSRQQLEKDFIREMRHLSKLRHPCIIQVM